MKNTKSKHPSILEQTHINESECPGGHSGDRVRENGDRECDDECSQRDLLDLLGPDDGHAVPALAVGRTVALISDAAVTRHQPVRFDGTLVAQTRIGYCAAAADLHIQVFEFLGFRGTEHDSSSYENTQRE